MRPTIHLRYARSGLAAASLCAGVPNSCETLIDWSNTGRILENIPTGCSGFLAARWPTG
jgi:hypothetical protein